MTTRAFRTHEDDGLKAEAVFTNNENQWKRIRSEVKEWVWQSWPTWMDEKPAWFDEQARSIIPVDMIPSLEDQKQILADGAKIVNGATTKDNSSVGEEGTMMGRTNSQIQSWGRSPGRGGGRNSAKRYAKIAPQGSRETVSVDTTLELIIMSGKRDAFSL